MNNLEEQARLILKEFNRISPPLLVRRLKISWEKACEICQKVLLEEHKQARLLTSQLEKITSKKETNS